MRNIKLAVEYDGTEFLGWQIQPGGRTVQGDITAGLRQVLREEVNLIGAGRTDTGVHARGQVANFQTESREEPSAIMSSLNGVLHPDIRILSAEDVPEAFHSRFDAMERMYRYHLSTVPSALTRFREWYVRYKLDFGLLEQGAALVSGFHDFTSFSKVGTEAKHYCCDVRKSVWSRVGGRFVYEIRADRFVRGMVRALVGNMVDLARGHISVAEFVDILESRDRSKAGTAAPPYGLYLEEVVY
jgi:tRNA pseudouridine38-40 synthase